MMRINIYSILRFLILLISFTATKTFAFENLVYTWRGFPTEINQGTTAINDLEKHASQINILSSQAYHLDEKGILYGSLNPQMVQIAKRNHVKLMPLIGNINFDPKLAHIFLTDQTAQKRALQSILQLCKENQFAGVQIDFEGMSFLDRDAFTRFYQNVATLLHQNGFRVSIAIVPMLTDVAPTTDYLKGRYEKWSGVYDYKLLGKSSDFVTLMTYDQHGSITAPGPMAGFAWVDAIVQYALKFIPAEKLSLGIPWHSGYWYTGKESDNDLLHAISKTLTFPAAIRLLKDNNATLRWDDSDKMHYAMFKNHFLYEYIFVEDAASLKAKLDLVTKYHLRGISNWCLGEEDPAIWNLLPSVSS